MDDGDQGQVRAAGGDSWFTEGTIQDNRIIGKEYQQRLLTL